MVRVHPAVPAKYLNSLNSFRADERFPRADLPKGSKEVPRVHCKARVRHNDSSGTARGMLAATSTRRRAAVIRLKEGRLWLQREMGTPKNDPAFIA